MKSNMSKDFKRKADGLRKPYYDGGQVRGPGNETSDSVDASLSDGEYVLPADTVRHVGQESLDRLRAATHTPVHGGSDTGDENDSEYRDGGYMHKTSRYNQTGGPTSAGGMADGGDVDPKEAARQARKDLGIADRSEYDPGWMGSAQHAVSHFLGDGDTVSPNLGGDALAEDLQRRRVAAGTGSSEDIQADAARRQRLRDTDTPFDTPIAPFALGLSGAKAAASAAGRLGSGALSKAGGAISGAAGATKDFLGSAISRLRGKGASDLGQTVGNTARDVGQATGEAVGKAASAAKDFAGNAASTVKDFAGGAATGLRGQAAPVAAEAAQTAAPSVTAKVARTAAPEVAPGFTRDAAGRIVQTPVANAASLGTKYGAGTVRGNIAADVGRKLTAPSAPSLIPSANAEELSSPGEPVPAAVAAPARQTGDQFLQAAGIGRGGPLYQAKTRLGQLGSGFIGSRGALQGSTSMLNQQYNQALRTARLGMEQRKFAYEQGQKGEDRKQGFLDAAFQLKDPVTQKSLGPDKAAQEGFKDYIAQSDPKFAGLNDSQLTQKLNQLDPQDIEKIVSQFKSMHAVGRAVDRVQGNMLWGGRVSNKFDPVAQLREPTAEDVWSGKLNPLSYAKRIVPFTNTQIIDTDSGRLAPVTDIASNPEGHGWNQDTLDTVNKQIAGAAGRLRRRQ